MLWLVFTHRKYENDMPFDILFSFESLLPSIPIWSTFTLNSSGLKPLPIFSCCAPTRIQLFKTTYPVRLLSCCWRNNAILKTTCGTINKNTCTEKNFGRWKIFIKYNSFDFVNLLFSWNNRYMYLYINREDAISLCETGFDVSYIFWLFWSTVL